MHDGWMWGMGWFWWLFWILLIGGVIWAIVRRRGGTPPSSTPAERRETPMEALERRYAEGAISTEEYEERKKHLRGNA